MIDKQKIQDILSDLYQLDPMLRQRETELRPLIEELLRATPDIPMSDAFLRTLRARLVVEQITNREPFSFLSFFSMRKLPLAVGGIALAAIVLVPFVYMNLSTTRPNIVPPRSFFASSVRATGDNAFGSLAVATDVNTISSAEGVRDLAISARPQAAPATNPVAYGLGAGGDAMKMIAPDAMIAPAFINYNYVYKGEALDTLPSTMPVYRRIKGSSVARDMGNYLSRFDTGLMDLSKLGNSELRHFELYTPGENGYSVSVNLAEGNISYYRSSPAWNVSEPRPLAPSDLPNNEEIISIANRFLQSLGVSTESYGTPVVDENWRIYYDQVADKSQAWVPATLTVTYPTMIEGQQVGDASGGAFGLQVSVSARTKEAMSIWNLNSQQYEKSDYQIEQDNAKLLDIVSRGGMNWVNYGSPEYLRTVETKEVELGTPTLTLIQHTIWDEKGGKELYVPAYAFPIINASQDIGMRFIVVPLPKEILETYDNGRLIDGPIRILDAKVPQPAVMQDPGVTPSVGPDAMLR